jgi:membrane-associated protease RseP (regulator of RpoE activity)
MKGRIRDRKALLDIGAAGPLSGFIVSLFALYIGVKTAKLVPFSEDQAMILFNPNILFNLAFARWLPVTDANYIIQSPILDAAWVGMFVTMLNLFPIGQLDGGHIAYACLGRFSVYLSWAVLGLMMLTGAVSMLAGALFSVSLFWEGWFFFAAFALILMGPRGVKHPPPVFPEVRLDPVRWLIAIIALIVFLLTFIPMPFVVMGLIF